MSLARRGILTTIAIVWVCVAGCEGRPLRPATPVTGVILLLVDALRPDHLGCYGYQRPTSPHIDALAAAGTRFANAVTPAPWTLPALGTLMTGLYPSVHGAAAPSNIAAWMANREAFRPVNTLDESRTTLAEVLRAGGFGTAAFINGSYPARVFGFGQGFEHFADNELPGIRLNVEAALDWIEQAGSQRFFVYLHAKEVHSPYAEPPGLEWITRKESTDPRYRHITQAVAEEGTRHRQFAFDAGYDGRVDGSWSTLQGLARSRQRPAPRDLEHLMALYDQGVAYTDYC
jgi:arylsulfatase A-like enzyme